VKTDRDPRGDAPAGACRNTTGLRFRARCGRAHREQQEDQPQIALLEDAAITAVQAHLRTRS
jgi:hypothetical protein